MRIIFFCLKQSLRHPLTLIVLPNPGTVLSPVPWWGSCLIVATGITTWILSENFAMPEMGEAARAMVYIPLGNMFGMTIGLRKKK